MESTCLPALKGRTRTTPDSTSRSQRDWRARLLAETKGLAEQVQVVEMPSRRGNEEETMQKRKRKNGQFVAARNGLTKQSSRGVTIEPGAAKRPRTVNCRPCRSAESSSILATADAVGATIGPHETPEELDPSAFGRDIKPFSKFITCIPPSTTIEDGGGPQRPKTEAKEQLRSTLRAVFFPVRQSAATFEKRAPVC
mmetsp:Transcript_1703/g.7436  ORF Transcript_1703/g.7436 Transcript_1703/m.7436 type:complete len:197 (+) Transcript_1703:2123-2713(+)